MKSMNLGSRVTRVHFFSVLAVQCVVLSFGGGSSLAESREFHSVSDVARSLDDYYRSLYPISFSHRYEGEQQSEEGEFLHDGSYVWTKYTRSGVGNSVDGSITSEFSNHKDTLLVHNSLYLSVAEGYQSAFPEDSGFVVLGELPTSVMKAHFLGEFSYPEILGWFSLSSGASIYFPDFLKENSNADLSRKMEDGIYLITIEKEDFRYVWTLGVDGEKCYVKRFSQVYLGNRYSSGRLLEKNISFENFVRVNNRIFPQRMTSSFEMLLADIVSLDQKSNVIFKNDFSVSFTNIKLNRSVSDSDFRIKTIIPNANPVTIQGAPHIEYIWYDGKIVPNDGKIVPKTGQSCLPSPAAADTNSCRPDSPYFWMFALSFLLIALGLGKMVYNIIQRNKRGGMGTGGLTQTQAASVNQPEGQPLDTEQCPPTQ